MPWSTALRMIARRNFASETPLPAARPPTSRKCVQIIQHNSTYCVCASYSPKCELCLTVLKRDAIFKRPYEDRVLGHISVEQSQTLSGSYTEEQEKVAAEIPVKEAAIQKLRDTASSTGNFIAKAKRYTDITELTPELLELFIQKIVVYEKSTKWPKKAIQAIEIHTAVSASLVETFCRARKAPGRKSQHDSCRGALQIVDTPIKERPIPPFLFF